MKTTLFVSRHSKSIKDLIYVDNELEQLRNEMLPLSVEGERKAWALSQKECLKNIDVICSSHYVRAISTAKYIAKANALSLYVDKRLGERKFGVSSIKELPDDFFEHQICDWNYKISPGESLNEVSSRMNLFFDELLHLYKGKKIMVVAHATCLVTFFAQFCLIRLNEKSKLVEIYFNGHKIFDGAWDAPELFKLEFEDDKLITIENIKVN